MTEAFQGPRTLEEAFYSHFCVMRMWNGELVWSKTPKALGSVYSEGSILRRGVGMAWQIVEAARAEGAREMEVE